MKNNAYPEKLIECLTEIKKELYTFLYHNIKNNYPTDSEDTNSRRTAIVLNELVLYGLKGDLPYYRKKEAPLIDAIKQGVMKEAVFKEGILTLLTCKGGLLKSWGHLEADTWIAEAKRIDSEADIPNSIERISDKASRFLQYYRSASG